MSETPASEVTSFTGNALLAHLRHEFPESYVEQTGGGTATILVRRTLQDAAEISCGPGTYNWGKPENSVFNTGEFYYGRSDYDAAGNEFPDEAPPERVDPDAPMDLPALAVKIAECWVRYNPEVVPEDPEEDGQVLSTKALPGNPFAAVVDNSVGQVREVGALMALAFELRTKNMIAVKGYVGIEEIAQRMGYSVTA